MSKKSVTSFVASLLENSFFKLVIEVFLITFCHTELYRLILLDKKDTIYIFLYTYRYVDDSAEDSGQLRVYLLNKCFIQFSTCIFIYSLK
jgi:hypothetical protein